MGAFLPHLTRSMAAGTYAIPRSPRTPRSSPPPPSPVAAYRGAGRPEATAAIERAVDLFAAESGLDPAEVRRRNLVPRVRRASTMPTGATYDCGDFPAALERVLEAAGYDDLRAEQAPATGGGATRALGIGAADLRRGDERATAGRAGESRPGRAACRRRRRGRGARDDGCLTPRARARDRAGDAGGRRARPAARRRAGGPRRHRRGARGARAPSDRGRSSWAARRRWRRRRTVIAEARRRAADLLEAAPDDVVLDVGRRAVPRGGHARRVPVPGRTSWRARRGGDPGGPRRRRRHRPRRRLRLRHHPAHLPVRRPRGGGRGRHRDRRRPPAAARRLRRRRAGPQPAAGRGPAPRRPRPGRGPGAVRGDGLRRRRQPADRQLGRLRRRVRRRAAVVRAGRHGDADVGQPARRQGHRRVRHDRVDAGGPERGVRRRGPPRRAPHRHAVHPRAGVAGHPGGDR